MAAARSELCCEWREAEGALAALLGLLELVFGLNLCVEAHNLDRENQRPLARCLPEYLSDVHVHLGSAKADDPPVAVNYPRSGSSGG